MLRRPLGVGVVDDKIPLHVLRLHYPLIYERDLRELFGGLGFVPALEERERLVFVMPIEFPWRAVADAQVYRWDAEKGLYHVSVYASHVDAGRARVGTVHYTESVKALRRYCVPLMEELFASVDTADETMRCPRCGEGWLGWQGDASKGVPRRAHVRCAACDWEGPHEGFRPVKEWT